MADTNIFSFGDYKEYLRDLVERSSDPRSESPHRILSLADLARRTGYQRSFFSRVLHAELHLTSEAAFKVANALKFSEREYKYFSWLLEKARAGDKDYRKYAEVQANKIKEEHEKLQKIATTPISPEASYLTYYMSSWTWVSVHFATSVTGLQTPEQISEYLNVPLAHVKDILATLVSKGLVRTSGQKYIFETGAAHITDDSPWVHFHHQNWRQRAMTDSLLKKAKSLHSTYVMAISKDDFENIRTLILKSIEKINKIAGPSEPEEVACLGLDFFKLSSS